MKFAEMNAEQFKAAMDSLRLPDWIIPFVGVRMADATIEQLKDSAAQCRAFGHELNRLADRHDVPRGWMFGDCADKAFIAASLLDSEIEARHRGRS